MGSSLNTFDFDWIMMIMLVVVMLALVVVVMYCGEMRKVERLMQYNV